MKFYRDSALDGGSDTLTGINSDCGGQVCGYENPNARELYDIRVGTKRGVQDFISLKNVSASVGALYKLPDKSYIGFGYVALPGAFGTLNLSGDATITGSPRDGSMTTRGTAEIGFRMAQMAYLGHRRKVYQDMQWVSELRWQDWSRHRDFDIRLFGGDLAPNVPEWSQRHQGLKDVWRLSTGLENVYGNNLEYGARLRFESNAVDNNRVTPFQVAGTNFTLAGGVQLNVSDHWTLGLAYDLTWFPQISTGDSAFDPRSRVACVDAALSHDRCAATRDGRDHALATGDYQRLQQSLALSLRYDSI
jgi:long-subunit fatty acid transport protein